MPGQHKTKLLGWHPSSAEDAAWVRAEAARRGVKLRELLDQMLAEFRARTAVSTKPCRSSRPATPQEASQPPATVFRSAPGPGTASSGSKEVDSIMAGIGNRAGEQR